MQEKEFLYSQLRSSEEIRKNQAELIRLMQETKRASPKARVRSATAFNREYNDSEMYPVKGSPVRAKRGKLVKAPMLDDTRELERKSAII